MEPFVEQLRKLCVDYPTRAKWVFVPAHAIGRTIADRIVLAGTDWANLRFVTPLDVALRMGAPFLVERGIDPSEEGLGPALIMRLLLRLPEEHTYFRPLGSQPELARALWSTITELRMAGVRPEQLSRAAFESSVKRDDPNFLVDKETPDEGYYRILIDKSQEEIVAKLEALRASIAKGDLKAWEFQGMKAIWFSRHLYEPLLFLGSSIVEVSPAPLNKGERLFVEDLRAFYDAHPTFFKGREFYLLRNLSRGRGVGFFEAGNFHPDFIAWQVEGAKQFVTFVDPKGIRNLAPTDPKIEFADTIKEIEDRLGDPNVILSSFIISNTPAFRMEQQWGISRSEMDGMNILFQDEDKGTYIEMMLTRARIEG